MFSYLDSFTKIYLLLLCAVLGLVMGSALNCLAFRMAHQQKWTGGRSRCVSCGHELKWNDLVPVFSYLFLKGRCRYCGEKISPRYFLAELTLGIVFPALLLRYDLSLDFAVMAVLFAFLSLLIILALSYKLDCSLSTNTIILIGVIFSMFTSSAMNLIITFANDHVRSIAFWTMGSFAGANYIYAALLTGALLLCGGVILRYSRELNAFAIGEENAVLI